ncbi:unnamed protein product [Pedinophyceae sp. YPF-701]|nr:unnamed protein product [Pedinophyceae sp. YPF-701]
MSTKDERGWDAMAERFWREEAGRSMQWVQGRFDSQNSQAWRYGERLYARKEEMLRELGWMTEEQWRRVVREAPTVLNRTPDNVRQQVEGLREVLHAGEGEEGDAAVARAIRRRPDVLTRKIATLWAKRDAVEKLAGTLLGEVREGAGVSGGDAGAAGAGAGGGRKQGGRHGAYWAEAGATVEGVATKMIGAAPQLLTAAEKRVAKRARELIDLMEGRVGRACAAGVIMSKPTLLSLNTEKLAAKWRLLVWACERCEGWRDWLDSAQAGSIGTVLASGLERIAVLVVIVDLAEEWEAGAVREGGDMDEKKAAVWAAAAELVRKAPKTLVDKSNLEGSKSRKGMLERLGVDLKVWKEVVEERAKKYADAAV